MTYTSDMPHYQLYINGVWQEGSDQQTMTTTNPGTGKPWATFACTSKTDVNRCVESAQAALSGPWGDLTATERGKLLYKLGELIGEHAKDLGTVETRDSGKLLQETETQTGYVADYYRYFAGLADKVEGATLPIDKPDMHVFTTRMPIGVVVAVVPWNAQMFLTATKLGPALAAGCTVVLKASEIAPCTMFEFAKLVEKAGFPPGVVSVITGDAENCAIPLTSHPDVHRIAFTGGTETARHVIRNTANNFAVTTLELGGKSPIVVFDDADLESAANGLIAGNFGASGQSCVAGSRAIVHNAIKEQIMERVIEKAKHITIGDPLNPDSNMGPLCTTAQLDNIRTTLASSVQQGASIRMGGEQLPRDGNFFQPTIVDCPNRNIDVLKREMFGPIMSVLGFDTEAEAVELANDTDFGLGSGLFTQSLPRAHRVSQKIKAGMCWINTYRAISPIAPFGGFKHSGYGRESGVESILDYTRTKTTWINISDKPMANPFIIR